MRTHLGAPLLVGLISLLGWAQQASAAHCGAAKYAASPLVGRAVFDQAQQSAGDTVSSFAHRASPWAPSASPLDRVLPSTSATNPIAARPPLHQRHIHVFFPQPASRRDECGPG